MSSQDFIRPDGAKWQTFQRSNVDVLLTARGQELLAGDGELENRVCAYLSRSIGGMALEQCDGIRAFFDEGTNGRVYNLDYANYKNSLLVKETNGHSMVDALTRLDRVKEIVDKRRLSGAMPDYIDVPDHYGVVKGADLPSQYVLMQGIDSGINVDDILNFRGMSAKERAGIDQLIGPINASAQDEVREGYQKVGEILFEAIAEETGHDPTLLLSDWHEKNVVLERLDSSDTSSNWAYWVIDQ